MSKDLINIGIIGSGYISDFHIHVLKSFKSVNISAIYSRNINNAKYKAEKYKIPFFTNKLNNFLKNNYDGIYILVSADQIYKFAKIILSKKIPVLIEKPPGLNIKELNELIKISRKNNTINLIGTNRRYYSIFKKIFKHINSNNRLISILIEGHENYWNILKLNKSKKILSNWQYSNSIHTVDLINFFAKSSVDKVISNKSTLKKHFNVSALIKYKNGINATYISNWSSPDRYSIKIFTEKKTFFIKPLEECYYLNQNFKKINIIPDKVDKVYKPGFYKLSQNFIGLINGSESKWPDNNLESIQATYDLIRKIYK